MWLPSFSTFLLKAFLPALGASVLFFVLILELGDLFANLVAYMQNQVTAAAILKGMLLFLPRCLAWALPVATLFSISYTLGSMHASNELMAVFASGVSLRAFALPLLVFSFALSAGYLVFEDAVVIPTQAAKRSLTRQLLKVGQAPAVISQVTIMGSDGRLVWSCASYDAQADLMNGVTVVERDDSGEFASRLDAQSASWDGKAWAFNGVRRYYWADGFLRDQTLGSWSDPLYAQDPASFRSGNRPVDEMDLAASRTYIKFLKEAGLPSTGPEAEYLKRFSFSLTPLVVALLSIALCGRYKKNVLLMSLLISLVGATLYYVAQMISMLLAKNEAIPAYAGAFFPVVFFMALSSLILAKRKA